MPHSPSFQRARSAEAKEERSAALLTAARQLAADKGVRAVTLTEIATTAGVHVSGVRRYFGSREEIFLRLAAEEWQAWTEEVRRGLEKRTDLPALLSQTLAGRGLFCDLLAHVPLTLEREVPAGPVREYKLAALAAVDVFVAAVTGATGLSERDAVDLVAAVTALAGNLWQISHPPQTLTRLYAEDARIAHAASDFTPRLTRLVAALVDGLARAV
ncbi:TetR family transcriptional regulator [Actinoplanes sp. RD1]|uniref:TetR family transcriptional regulator n=1 Tax=Actinoplanes sp. RD1 TaxID=3064538 RepID=UPI002741815B|nr:TetR family transcriptional regulator [Actinoplanes sp. RD1]